MEETFLEKLKSWKRWMAVIAAMLPIISEAISGSMGWSVAIPMCVTALLVGMGVIAADDMSKRKEAIATAALAADAKKNG